ncbi:hypothetical protein DSD19_09635 [Rhodovulum sp. BSW8]|nr:hypothetical protein DSD19_09635 [Rhodovulum sp. BSW8]
MKRSSKLFRDATRAPVLGPGRRRAKTGASWTLERDERPSGGGAPPGVASCSAAGRGGQQAERILQGSGGAPQEDSYPGYTWIPRSGWLSLGVCQAQAGEDRRDRLRTNRRECTQRIGGLYRIASHPRPRSHCASRRKTRAFGAVHRRLRGRTLQASRPCPEAVAPRRKADPHREILQRPPPVPDRWPDRA